MDKEDYLENLPEVTFFERNLEAAKREQLSFMIELKQKYRLTPSQQMFLLSDSIRFIAGSCMAIENRLASE